MSICLTRGQYNAVRFALLFLSALWFIYVGFDPMGNGEFMPTENIILCGTEHCLINGQHIVYHLLLPLGIPWAVIYAVRSFVTITDEPATKND